MQELTKASGHVLGNMPLGCVAFVKPEVQR